jgi:hypothetical protein
MRVFGFGDAEALALHQLRLLEWMVTAGQKRLLDEEPATAPSE